MLFFSMGFILPFMLFGFIITEKTIRRKVLEHTKYIQPIGGTLLLGVSIYLFYFAVRGFL